MDVDLVLLTHCSADKKDESCMGSMKAEREGVQEREKV